MEQRKRHSMIYRIVCLLLALQLTGCGILGGREKEYKRYTPKPEETPSASELPVVSLTQEEAADLARQYMKTMTVEEKIGQLFVVNLEQLDLRKGSYYEFKKCTKQMKETLQKYPVGGVILFSRNISKPKKTTKLLADLQEASRIPLFAAVDEEGGDVARIASNENMGTTAFPSAEEIGKKEDGDYVYNMGRTIAREIRSFGFNVNFAPVADVKTSELNTEIGNRSFGDDPDQVADLVSAFVQGSQELNVSAALKHFPGQGSSTGDTHLESVDIDSSITKLRKYDFVPFQAGIKAEADFVMVSHISVSRVTETTEPASMSALVLKTILREELGFRGIAITDAFDMSSITDKYTPAEAAYNAIKGGADIVLMPGSLEQAYQELLTRLRNGDLETSRIEESVLRILTVKFRRGILREEDLQKRAVPSSTPEATATPKATVKPSGSKHKKSGKK